MSNKWIPLESNPDVMNKYLRLLGVRSPLCFCDVWGFDPDLLQMIARPVKALVLLFPITEKYEKFRKEEETRILKNGQIVSKEIYFVRQTIPNACGTIGLLHALANNKEALDMGDGPLARMLERTKDKTPEERASVLEADQDLTDIHQQTSADGQTAVWYTLVAICMNLYTLRVYSLTLDDANSRATFQLDIVKAPSADEEVDLHFVCFVEKDGHLYELDGRKPFPINHGSVSGDLLMDSVSVVQQFMEREPGQVNFSILALAPPQLD
ncbi:hypothetical protein BASA50_002014 [Batrachochytrium salamandrivorans]|uniref:Ubiquitin carboxyl-terminal hydrolase n=1 Tax=Batrachochytrium salamandrivorans TaxID=1357716 RepID=A0ABQ8FMG5_9FUNG|nr:hypothetical protein BASA60_003771 [Batrachochytrium salamandrivorans]KAH6580766.1 hypothetical protein BASA61_009440 [Batrachochytrium salamandrivorans]KAH6600845.1 hypothetical protein BASA50_002014 [Batrachochytrium salamandrivorans]KAH9266625.1 hypothetical protein BASA83_010429 [Batrachochytrium salamandrivorans]